MGSQADKAFVSQGGELSVKALCRGEWSTLRRLSEAFSLLSEPRGGASEGIEGKERKGKKRGSHLPGGERARNHYRERSLSAMEVPVNALREVSIMY